MLSKLVIISGLSGSGKSSALNALEDLDYYAIDNLPIKLFEKFTELLEGGGTEFSKIALVMDLRDSAFVENYPFVFRKVLKNFRGSEILFLDANDEVLTRRFSETRRKHPLSNVSIIEGIEKERKLLGDLKDLATSIIDTSTMDVHALKKRIIEQFAAPGTQKMQIRFVSFGFKNGVPKNCDLLFDVRFLNNPHFVPELRANTGLDDAVQKFILKDIRAEEFLNRTTDYLKFLIPHYATEGKTYLSIGIGCTGGKHRSVFMAKEIFDRLKSSLGKIHPIVLEHQDLRTH
ncbi:MAG: RNase adapter RapZ [Deltaproteobacteria bacterium]|nr:RNase adapter RapZ [Deltaproteobacteria bacterium]